MGGWRKKRVLGLLTVKTNYVYDENDLSWSRLAQRKAVRFINSFSVGTRVQIALSAKRRHEFFARKFLHYKGDPDSSKDVTGICKWTKRHLLRTNRSYLSLSEKVKNIVI